MNWCCVQWESLSPELALHKQTEISKFVEEKGIPQSVFATTLKFLQGMEGICPFCGTVLKQHQTPHSEPKQAPEPIKRREPRVCRPCGGKGTVSSGVNCMNCLGKGVLDSTNTVSEVGVESSTRFSGKKAQQYQQGLRDAQEGKAPKE